MSKNNILTKNVSVSVNIDVARKLLVLSGYRYREIEAKTDDEIFDMVLTLNDCDGMSFHHSNEEELER